MDRSIEHRRDRRKVPVDRLETEAARDLARAQTLDFESRHLIGPFAEQRLEGGHQPFEILRMRLLRGPRPNRIIAVEKAAQSRHFLLRLARHDGIDAAIDKIGRASCRESVCQYV